MTDPATLIHARRAFVIAPAGCGKTQLIANAVYLDATNRSLILTHTYAGVDVLRKRLKALGTAASTYEVDTIAGWSLRLTASFPSNSGITMQRPVNEEWDAVYVAARSLLSYEAIKTVIQASFDSVYIDEYQDCSPSQHEIIIKLADILPTRIFGDPLQGIFDFGGAPIVDWQTHVAPYFEELPSLDNPYRWSESNPALGDWLLTVREKLETHEPVDLSQAPEGCVRFIQLPRKAHDQFRIQMEICMSVTCRAGETLLAIHNWEHQCHGIARQTGGKFRSPETIECNELFNYAKQIDDAPDKQTLARVVFEFSYLCLTKVKGLLEGPACRIFDGRGLQNRQYQHQDQLDALKEIAKIGSLQSAYRALVLLAGMNEAKIVRYELFQEMLKALREYNVGQHNCLEEAAISIRDRTRRNGRAPGRYVISRTLLVKGLEFDHAIILNANTMNRKNLYVALTRASRTLTVLGESPIFNPE